jgi:CheY-like chemotaxis protein
MSPYQTILLVEDDKTANFLHRRLFNRVVAANHIAEAGNGEEALNYLRTHATKSENTPMLILLDIKMPVLDGFEFLQEYERIADKLNPNIRIIMLSSSVSPIDLARIKSFPRVSGYYTKPLSVETVQKILADTVS